MVDGVFLARDKEDGPRTDLVEGLGRNEDILDIGPKTIEKFKKIIEKAGTILLGGSMGMYEDERFEKGTKEIVQAIIDNKSSFNVAGGGETLSFIKKFKFEKGFNFLSTGGGAMLKLLNKKDLPGIIALK